MPKINVENLIVETQETVDHKDLFRVGIKTKQEKQDIQVTLEKVAIFNSATRVYVTISNHSDHDVYLNEASIQLLADGETVPGKYEMLDKKIRLERYLIPNDETYGALSFNKMKISTEKIEFEISFSSEENEKPINFKFKENM